MHYIKKYN